MQRLRGRLGLLRAVLAASAASAALGSPTVLLAQTASTQTSVVSYNIPSQPLTSALTDFARTSGLRLAYPAALTEGLNAPALSGSMSPERALSQLLSGTGIAYQIDGNTVTLGRSGGAPVAYDGSIVLDEVNVSAWVEGAATGWDGSAETVYSTPASVSHISAETIAQFRGTTPGDILKGVPGLMTGASRSSGAIDANIQGLQGMGRVAVTVDGAENAMTVYHAYQGVSNRTYIDPDFIGGVSVQKGPGTGATGVGAIGGTVSMRTISADDIIPDGESYAIRINGEVGTNTSDLYPVGQRTLGRSLLGYLWTADSGGTPATPMHDIDRPGLFLPTGASGSVTFASRSENVDLVLGAARRQYGNYHVGENGEYAPQQVSEICDGATGSILNYCNRGGIPYTIGLTTYLPGEQVLNTSQDVFSTLAKATIRNGDHRLELSHTHYDSIYGETFPLQFVTSGQLTSQNIRSSSVLDTYALRYRWNPADDLYDLRVNTSFTHMDEQTPGSVGGSDTISKWSQVANADVSNTSSFDTGIGRAALTYGLTYKHEATAPDENDNSGFVPRHGTRDEASIFTNGTLSPTDWLRLDGGLRYHHYWLENMSAFPLIGATPSTREQGEWDYSVGASVTPTDGVQLFANYQNAARMPSLFEGLGSPLIAVDPNIGAERARRWEVGGNLTANGLLTDDDALKVKLAYFNNTVDDYIYRYADRPPGATSTTLLVTNLAQAKFSGVELSGQYDNGGFSAALAATWYNNIEFCRTTDTCINSSLRSDYAANHIPPGISASLTLSQKFLDDRLTLSGRATYYGERGAEAEDPAGYGAAALLASIPWKPVLLLDAYAEYKLTDNTRLTLSIENLTDEYYVDPLSLTLVPAPGRTIKAGIRGTFDPTHGFGDWDGVPSGEPRDWSGLYVGGNLGLGTATARIEQTYLRTTTAHRLPAQIGNVLKGSTAAYEGGSETSFFGGLRAGLNHHLDSRVVLGMDAEANWGDFSLTNPDDARASLFETRYDMLGSINARVGLAWDDVLVYGKAGLAFGQVQNYIPNLDAYQTNTGLGLAAGAGVEVALTDNLSIFGEYQHLRLSTDIAYSFSSTSGTTSYDYDYNWINRGGIDLFKAGLNFRF